MTPRQRASVVRTRPGRPYPLGAVWDGSGVNVALFSGSATAVELCPFDDAGRERRIPVVENDDQVWHVYVPDARPGARYGYRVQRPQGSGEPPPLQSRETPARSLRAGRRRHDHVGRLARRLRGRRRRRRRPEDRRPRDLVAGLGSRRGRARAPDVHARAQQALRRRHPLFRRRQFFFGRKIHGSEVKDLTWSAPTARR